MNCSPFLRIPLLAILFFLFASPGAEAQLIKRRYYNAQEMKPAALLVQLPTYSRREAYIKKSNNAKWQAQLQQDKTEMVRYILMDFNDNFTFCPVYFFYDTYATQVRQGKLDGILMDGQLQPVAAPQGLGTNFQVAVYGPPVNVATDNLTEDDKGDASAYTYGTQRPRYTLLNHQYEKLSSPLPNGANNRGNGKMKQKAAAYKYESKYFDIAYRPQARGLSRKMAEFYSEKPD